MGILWQDFRYGLRGLLRQPVLTVVAVLSLALGIGANSAIFSVVNAVLLRPPPYLDPERLVMLWGTHLRTGRRTNPVSPADFTDWQAQNRVFEQIATSRDALYNLTGRGEPEQIFGYRFSANFLQVLGVRPATGRAFLPEEDRPGGQRVVLLGHRFWQRRFAGDPQIIGQALNLNGESYTVIGVMPPGFEHPRGAEVWTPLALDPGGLTNRELRFLRLVARLRPGVTIEQAQADMETIARRQEQEHPKTHTGWRVNVVSLRRHYLGEIQPALFVLSGAVGFVLLIACANVSTLLLSRSAARRKEMAVRAALGASRLRLVRQLLTESMVLALLGGFAATAPAMWSIKLLLGLFPNNIANVQIPRVEEITVDGRVLGFTLLVSMLSGVIFGLVPALQSSGFNLNKALKGEGGGDGLGAARAGRFRYRARELAVIAEVALSLVLFVGAGLMIRSFLHLREVKLGFNPENVLTLRIILPTETKYPRPEERRVFLQRLLPRLETLPGVASVGVINHLPLSGWKVGRFFTVEGQPPSASGEQLGADFRIASPNYFQAMGISLVKGRYFTERDHDRSPPVVVINETLARRFFPDVEPVGKRVSFPSTPGDAVSISREIIGVIGDVKHDGLDVETKPELYAPYLQEPSPIVCLALRVASDPMSMAGAVRREVGTVDKDQPVSFVMSLEQLAAESVARQRISTLMLGIYAALAFVLVAVGIYGVMLTTVSQRTHEIGIRIALGAQPRDLLRLVVGHGMGLALAGLGLGLAASLALTRLMAHLLYGISAADPLTFAAASALLAGVALLACYVPARRATKVDPLLALRQE